MSRDIKRVWRMSGEKYRAKRQDILATMGPKWSIWDDLPSEPDEVESSYPLALHGFKESMYTLAESLFLTAMGPKG